MYIISFSISFFFVDILCIIINTIAIVIIGVREQIKMGGENALGGETFEYLYRISILILYSILFLTSTLGLIFDI